MPLQKLTVVVKKMHLKRPSINVCERPKLDAPPPSPTTTLSFGESNRLEDDTLIGAPHSPSIPVDIPKGYFAVYVGDECKRYVIPLKYLKHQTFKSLLRSAEEEFGYSSLGAIRLPCDTAFFDHLLWLLGGQTHLSESRKLPKC